MLAMLARLLRFSRFFNNLMLVSPQEASKSHVTSDLPLKRPPKELAASRKSHSRTHTEIF